MNNGEEFQKHINDEQAEDIKQLYKHADVANREMGVVKTDIKWIKKFLWWMIGIIITTSSVSTLVNITF